LQEREHPRFAHEAAITLRTADVVVAGRTANVSRGGLCATLAESISIGATLEVDVQLVFEDERQSEPLRLPGLAVWCTAVDDGYQVGVRFQAIDSETAENLTMFLRYLGGASDSPARRTKEVIPLDERFG
jgi:hypothetical protein